MNLIAAGKRLVALPVILLALPFALVAAIFGGETDLSANEIAKALRDFIDGTGGGWDWDDFTSSPLSDPVLDSIRQRALAIDLPVDAEGMERLRVLLAEVEAIA